MNICILTKLRIILRISKYKNIFPKGYNPIWSEEVFVIKKSQNYCSMDVCH